MPSTIQQLMGAHPEEILKELAQVRERESGSSPMNESF